LVRALKICRGQHAIEAVHLDTGFVFILFLFTMLTFIRCLRLKLALLLSSALLAACGGGGSPAAPPAGGLTLDPGDGQITVSWAADPAVTYWLAYLVGPSVSLESGMPHTWVNQTGVSSPFVLTGLSNGTTYAFSANGRTEGGPGGAATPSVASAPRPGGGSWVAGTTATLGTTSMRGVAYGAASDGNSNYVAVGDGGAIFRSTDGKIWTAVSTGPGATVNFQAAVSTLGKFIAVGNSGQIFYSTDIATWTAATPTTPATVAQLNALASNGTRVVVVGNGGTILYSADGVSWTVATSGTTNNLSGVTYAASGLWIAVGASGTLLTSADGSTWTIPTGYTADATTTLNGVGAQWTGFSYTYVAVGTAGVVLRSTDGSTWTAATIATLPNLTALVVPSTQSQFLAVGNAGAVFTSADGLTWMAQTSGSAADLLGLSFAQGQYVAVGTAGVNLNSH